MNYQESTISGAPKKKKLGLSTGGNPLTGGSISGGGSNSASSFFKDPKGFMKSLGNLFGGPGAGAPAPATAGPNYQGMPGTNFTPEVPYGATDAMMPAPPVMGGEAAAAASGAGEAAAAMAAQQAASQAAAQMAAEQAAAAQAAMSASTVAGNTAAAGAAGGG